MKSGWLLPIYDYLVTVFGLVWLSLLCLRSEERRVGKECRL